LFSTCIWIGFGSIALLKEGKNDNDKTNRDSYFPAASHSVLILCPT